MSRRTFLGAGSAGVALVSSRGANPAAAATDADGEATENGAPVRFTLNGEQRSETLDPRVTLVDLLRERHGLTGTKKGCDHGACGSCTVHIQRPGDEAPTRQLSCLTFAATLDGAKVTTIEGLPAAVGAKGEVLHPLQEAFLRCDAYQCGYCTPGQIMSAAALLKEDPAGGGHAGSREMVREWMSGNLCRCGAYPNIVSAVRQTAGEEPEEDPSAAVVILSSGDAQTSGES
ncbi:(2Fe-2S)-binding protein [Alienimonas californiensis]|uniref:(2Fe-2S)-binding protein n=1 Tax=Alienimonas californiensis TaxID=2527989 RepID=UPI001F61E56A|nr:(2Fe-2S)-binding protein [Alienimonas californiensis]